MHRPIIVVTAVAAMLASIGAGVWDPFPGDLTAALYVQRVRFPGLLGFMEGVSYLGRGLPMIIFGALLAAVFIWVFRFKRECHVAILTPVLFGLSPLMKLAVDRPRPPADLLYRSTQDFMGLGFPSGHAFQSALFFGLLVYLASVYVNRSWLRHLIQSFLIFLIAAIGVSRIYIGAHWPSDVVGGYLFAVPLLILVSVYHSRIRSKSAAQAVPLSPDSLA